MNRLRSVAALGQSLWLDYIRRDLILTGGLHRLAEEDGISGVTSNPSIFEKAIAQSPHYADALRLLLEEGDRDAMALFEALATRDIQDACDVLRPVFEKTEGGDGFVSMEVSPYLARDTEATLADSRRLKKMVGRPNLFIKIPATPQGIPAIRRAIAEGTSVNITLLFARDMYEKVAYAYLEGLEELVKKGGDPSKVASVASFFISRIDTLADSLVKRALDAGAGGAAKTRLEGLLGKVAIANGRLTYQTYKSIFSGPRWEALRARGARPQRVLWASTSTKNPAYRDVMYVEEMIGPDTVNTLPPQTIDAFRDHGEARPSLDSKVDEAKKTLDDLEAAGISLKEVTDKVLEEGVRLFSDSFDALLGAVERKRRETLRGSLPAQTMALPVALNTEVQASLEEWRRSGAARRLWAKDASLWTGGDEARWLGWLDVADRLARDPAPLEQVAALALDGRFTHALLMGMGGSSLAPDVLRRTFGKVAGAPDLVVLDSTDPEQIRAVEARLDLKRTLFIVSSKSGSTLEPNIFRDYFLARAKEAVGADEARHRFVAITDPGSSLEKEARRDGFALVVHGDEAIGGRYSALSPFGMAPAAAMGLDAAEILERARTVARSCAASVPPAENPGVMLGTILGVAGRRGRDKVTILASPAIAAFGAWLEQLLAESTGKQGKGLVPVDLEAVGAPGDYGADRTFIHLRLLSAPDAAQDAAVQALMKAGHPVTRIDLPDPGAIAGEFFRFEIATAVAGSLLGIDPFDQPDVEAAKIAARTLTADFEKTGSLPAEMPVAEGEGLKLFTDGRNAKALQGAFAAPGAPATTGAAAAHAAPSTWLKAHLGRVRPGDYVALLAFVPMNDATQEALQAIRHRIRAATKAATCLGFGPRFLHSTGQAYKGGPDSGVFIQITCDDARDLAVPGRKATFGVVKAAQARGDFQVLAERGRRALRVHLGRDLAAGLQALSRAIQAALSQ